MLTKRQDNTYDIDGVFVAYDYPYPVIELDIYTLINMHDTINLEALEGVLDRSPIIKAIKIDEKDPPRIKATEFKGILSNLVSNSRFSEVLIRSTSGGKFPITTMLCLRAKKRVGPEGGKDCGYSLIYITIPKKELEKNNNEIIELFKNICTSVNAFVGYGTEHSMDFQRSIYLAQAVKNVYERKTLPDYDREIKDIFWLNYFGQGYLNHWGKNKVIALEQNYKTYHTENGGIIVQATEEPMVADETIGKLSDYKFKQPFYEILGRNTFMHEDHQPGGRGENVPTIEYMRSIV